jgi:hypothetical protein
MKPDFQPEEVPLRTPVTYQMLGQILSEENPITYLEYPSLPLTATWAAKPRPQAFPLRLQRSIGLMRVLLEGHLQRNTHILCFTNSSPLSLLGITSILGKYFHTSILDSKRCI